MPHSGHFDGRIYHNPVPTTMMQPGSMLRVLPRFLKPSRGRVPAKPIGPFAVNKQALLTVPGKGVQVTWLGHSTVLIDVDGKRLLTDPVWYNRASPLRYIGPKRFFANPLPLDALPPIDYILLSHDHYDHLDKAAMLALTAKGIRVLTLLGVKKRLTNWGIPDEMVSELDWGDSMLLNFDYRITVMPARHFSGRWLGDRFTTLWGSFVIEGPQHRVYFGGDSGYFDGFAQIGKSHGPFDLALLEIGAYNEAWPDIHMGPENAVKAALDLGNPLLLPIHWGTFNLAMHPWKEPVERLIREADNKGVKLVLPAPGETHAVSAPYNSLWWRKYDNQ